jgi:hypothetical protein
MEHFWPVLMCTGHSSFFPFLCTWPPWQCLSPGLPAPDPLATSSCLGQWSLLRVQTWWQCLGESLVMASQCFPTMNKFITSLQVLYTLIFATIYTFPFPRKTLHPPGMFLPLLAPDSCFPTTVQRAQGSSGWWFSLSQGCFCACEQHKCHAYCLPQALLEVTI